MHFVELSNLYYLYKMSGTRKMKGGVRLASGYTDRNDALAFFLGNSTFRVLTNNSISCITLVVSIDPGVPSPYQVLRKNNFDARVDKILLKIFITANQSGWFPIEGRGPFYAAPPEEQAEEPPPPSFGIEITSKDDFLNEINIQRDVYRKSFLSEVSLLEPMCPHIFNYHHCSQSGSTVKEFESLNGLVANEQADLNKILQGGSIGFNQISFIAMEFMDGYEIASDILTSYLVNEQQDKLNFFLDMLQYEFQRLNMYKYIHGDAHFGNVMIHPDYDYLYGGQKGRVIIIDFGRTIKDDNIDTSIVDNDLERFRHEDWGIHQDRLIDIDKFNVLNTEKLQSMQQFYIDFGNYLETQGNELNGDRTYQTIRAVIEEIIDSNPQVYNVGGASSKTKIKTLMKTDYKVFKNNLIALFDDKANGELKGEIFALKRKRGRKQRKIKTRRNSERRRTRTNSTKLRKQVNK